MVPVVKRLRQLEELCSKYPDLLRQIDTDYRKIHLLPEAKVLQQEIEALKSNDNKCLNIGIVGRVKAGKSSLLNAVFFDGQDILPKAATPMTASLTVITYGQNKAEIELFSKEDIQRIAAISADYERTLLQKNEEQIKKNQTKLRRKLTPEEQQKIRLGIEVKLRSTSMGGYHRLYQDIKRCPLYNKVMSTDEPLTITLQANTPNAIAAELNKYVGSSGENHAVTKSAILELNMPELEGIRIIDTPGLNDPVPSRSQRTLDFMSRCDAALIISPTGQFMSADDLLLMNSLLQEHSIKSINVVASQADYAMISDLPEKCGHQFKAAFDKLSADMSSSLQTALSGDNSPALKEQLQGHPVILSSSICYVIQKKQIANESLNEAEDLVLNNFKRDYADFESSECQNHCLKMLSGIESVKERIAKARMDKERILEERSNEYEIQQGKNISTYQDALYTEIEKAFNDFKTLLSVENVERQLKSLQRFREAAEIEINQAVETTYKDLRKNIDQRLKRESENFINTSSSSAHSSIQTHYYNEDHESGFLWWKKKWTTQETEQSIDTNLVRRELFTALTSMQDKIKYDILEEIIPNWIKYAGIAVTRVLDTLENKYAKKGFDEFSFDPDDYKDAITGAIYTIRNKLPKLDLSDFDFNGDKNLPINTHDPFNTTFLFTRSVRTRSGKLTGYEVQEFIDEVEKFLSEIQRKFNQRVNKYIEELDIISKNINFNADLFDSIETKLEECKEKLKDRDKTIHLYTECLAELQKIK